MEILHRVCLFVAVLAVSLLVSSPASGGVIAYYRFDNELPGGRQIDWNADLQGLTDDGDDAIDHFMYASGGHLLLDGDRHHLDIGADGSVQEDGRFLPGGLANAVSTNFSVGSGDTLIIPAFEDRNPLDQLFDNPFVIEGFASTRGGGGTLVHSRNDAGTGIHISSRAGNHLWEATIQLSEFEAPVTLRNPGDGGGWGYFALVRSGPEVQLYHKHVHTGPDGPLTSVSESIGTALLEPLNFDFNLNNPSGVPDNNLDEVRITSVPGGGQFELLTGDVINIATVAGPPSRTFTWDLENGGDWNVATNWDPTFGGPPNGGHGAIFADKTTSDSTVFTDTSVSVSQIDFSHARGYAIAGRGQVNLVAGSNAQGDIPAAINVTQGAHEFQVPVALQFDTTVDVASDSTLVFNNAIDLMGKTLTKTGAGELAFRNDLLTSGGVVNCAEGTCSGSGTISGDLINDGGTISPGNSLNSMVTVPEPAALTLVALGSLLLLAARRRA